MLLAVRTSSNGCTWEVWRALKKLELLSAAPRLTLRPRLNDRTFSSSIVLDEAAKRSNIVRHTKCWMKMFELDQTFSFNILYV